MIYSENLTTNFDCSFNSNSAQKENEFCNQSAFFEAESNQDNLLNQVFHYFINGVLILTEKGLPIYKNRNAEAILRKLRKRNGSNEAIPLEIRHICKVLSESRCLFPQQSWLIESRIVIDQLNVFFIKARWIQTESSDEFYLLLVMEDQTQVVEEIAAAEAQQYGLTAREKEVWLLQRKNYTYKAIAQTLKITPNTVKKHMKHILEKQKTAFRQSCQLLGGSLKSTGTLAG
ncbi:helix-turn-helix transcriptional regulator [Sphaerothrix gracilis]|uniref:helix-turn-helix transcriptional regulator n=1 Tax=Sphaerothrix gracilis TaxID=3151835 RepID=UPI0031FBDE1F